MRAVIQRVARARVSVDGVEVGAIGPGLCVLIAVSPTDTEERAAKMASKLWQLRIMADSDGVMNRSVAETTGAVMVISQFTLYGDTRRGRRPSWVGAAPPEVAEPLVRSIADELRQLGATVATGTFGADMAVELVNDGPVTLILEVES